MSDIKTDLQLKQLQNKYTGKESTVLFELGSEIMYKLSINFNPLERLYTGLPEKEIERFKKKKVKQKLT